MILSKTRSLPPFVAIALLAGSLIAPSALAIITVAPEPEVILGQEGLINLLERDNLDGTVSYGFDNVSGETIALKGVAVSYNGINFGSLPGGNPAAFPLSSGGAAADWQTPYGHLGTFADLFGTDTHFMVFFGDSEIDFAAGTRNHLDRIVVAPSTEFVAFNDSGVVDRSRPVADSGSTSLVLAFALLSLVAIRRRLRQ